MYYHIIFMPYFQYLFNFYNVLLVLQTAFPWWIHLLDTGELGCFMPVLNCAHHEKENPLILVWNV